MEEGTDYNAIPECVTGFDVDIQPQGPVMPPQMDLHLASGQTLLNLDTIRNVLTEMGGEETIVFTIGSGAGMLRWLHLDDSGNNVHIALPLHWLTDAGKADSVEKATRHFANGVRFASAGLGR